MEKKTVLIVGGTGFIGYHAVKEFLKRGYRVTVLSLPPMPANDLFPPEVKIKLADLSKLSDEDIVSLVRGNYAVVFAAGADDRVVPKKPAYKFFYNANVLAAKRFVALGRRAGAKKAVILSSYFLYFERTRHELHLARHHPYIKSRKVQAQRCTEAGGEDIDVMILELPYIFGSMPGRKPLWCPLIKYLRNSSTIYFTHGGTNMIAVEHVAEAIAGAVEKGEGGKHYTIGDENMMWTTWLGRLMKVMDINKKIVVIPNWVAKLGMFFVQINHVLHGREGGLNMIKFVDLQTSNTFFDPSPARRDLGFGRGGLAKAFEETVRACKKNKC